MADKTNWKMKFLLMESDYNNLREKLEANISLFNKILAPMLTKAGFNPDKYIPKFLTPEFDNVDRKKYYGLRRGDLVDYDNFGLKHKNCIVVYFDLMDDNRVQLQTEDGDIFPAVAEWCKISKKMED